MGRAVERRRLKPVRLFASDLDGTLAGDIAGAVRFREAWESLPPRTRPILVYNSGRLLADIARFIPKSGLPEADFVIGGIGTMLQANDPLHYPGFSAGDFASYLGSAFNHARIAALLAGIPGLKRQPPRYQHAFKSSWYLIDAAKSTLDAIQAKLTGAGLDIRLIYSSARDLDVIPRLAGKGQTLAWLCERLHIRLDEVVVAGDSGNDSDMFMLHQVRGIIVANALPEFLALSHHPDLTYRAADAMARGVMAGLTKWGVFCDASSRPSIIGPKSESKGL